MEWKRRVNTNLCITIILMFAAIFTIIDFYIVGSQLDGYPFNDVSGSIVNNKNVNLNIDITDKNDLNKEGKSYISTTSVEVMHGSRDRIVSVLVVDGKLNVIIDNEVKEFEISGEKIKYIYRDYYQSSDTNVIFVLTESGNIYFNEFSVNDSDINLFNNFIKMNYSNVSELVLVDNSNYGNIDEAGFTDNKKTYIYALIDGDLVKIDNQYAM